MLADLAAEGAAAVEKHGFLGDVVAEFPECLEKAMGSKEPCKFRQVNLSAWTSDDAAHKWYVENESHRRIVQKHRRVDDNDDYDGALKTFSCMLAQLEPAKPVRYHIKCQCCGVLNVNYPASRHCKKCAGSLDGIVTPF